MGTIPRVDIARKDLVESELEYAGLLESFQKHFQ